MNKVTRGLFMIMVGIGAASPILCAAEPNNSAGAVFVMTNAADKNQVIAFERAANGTLGESISYDTQGRGSRRHSALHQLATACTAGRAATRGANPHNYFR